MNETHETEPDENDVEHLLPWFATGRLTRDDHDRVARALDGDAELARRLSLVEGERGEAIALNESLGVPSARMAETLLRQIGPEPRAATGIGAVIDGWVQRAAAALLPSRGIAWAAMAAALIIVIQAGVLGSLLVERHKPAYQTASAPDAVMGPGSFALVGFAADASAAQITSLLDGLKMSIVDGPRGGLYRVRLSQDRLSPDTIEVLLGQLRAQQGIVSFAAAAS